MSKEVNKIIKDKLKGDANKNGVYCFWFDGFENDLYVGSTMNGFYKRISHHLCKMRNGTITRRISLIYSKADINKFNFKILFISDDEKTVRLKEMVFINKLKPTMNKRDDYYLNKKEADKYEQLDKVND